MTRTEYIRIAKAIRNSGIAKNYRERIVAALIPAIKESTPLMDHKSFRSCANVDDFYDNRVGYITEKDKYDPDTVQHTD